jgi:hypothetical protein
VREEEQRGDPEARIILDTTLAGRPRVPSIRREGEAAVHFGFELGVEVTASIGVHLLERGFRVRCDRIGDPERSALSTATPSGYRMPGGDRMFLEDLARLDGPTGAVAGDTASADGADSAAPRAREARMPGFAVLVDPDEHDARTLVALRPAFEPAVAFVTEGVSARIVDALEHADWRVVRVRRPGEIGAAWSGTAAPARTRFAAATSPLAVHTEGAADAP